MADQSWSEILGDGERLIWQGQPEPRNRFRGEDAIGVVMGLFFMAFSVVWMLMASKAGGLFWMFGLIFFFIGLYNSVGRWIWTPMIRRRTWYSLSNQRAFIAVDHPIRGRSLKSYPIGPDTEITLEHGAFNAVWFASERRASKSGTGRTRIGFDMLKDTSEIMRHIRSIQEKTA